MNTIVSNVSDANDESSRALIAEAQTMIGGPGKFEGEGVETAYFYLRGRDGDGEVLWSDENGGGCTELFDVNDFERKAFAFASDVVSFTLSHDSQGFVSGEPLTAKQEAVERKYADTLNAEESGM
jgi:hypothetical protein